MDPNEFNDPNAEPSGGAETPGTPDDGGWDAGEPAGSGSGPNRSEQAARAREAAERWIAQLQEMIDHASRQAAPVMRDVAAKAAELAAVAAENAGPVAHRAANVTEHVGDRLAARSKELAADLRRAAESARATSAEGAPKPETDGTDDSDLGGPSDGAEGPDLGPGGGI